MSQEPTDQPDKAMQDLNEQTQKTTKTAQVATNVIQYWKEVERKQLELRQNLSDIVKLEGEIEALKLSARGTNHPPDLSAQRGNLSTMVDLSNRYDKAEGPRFVPYGRGVHVHRDVPGFGLWTPREGLK